MARSKREASVPQPGSERPIDQGSTRRGPEQPTQRPTPGGRPDAANDEPVAHVAEYVQEGSRWDVRCSCGSFGSMPFSGSPHSKPTSATCARSRHVALTCTIGAEPPEAGHRTRPDEAATPSPNREAVRSRLLVSRLRLRAAVWHGSRSCGCFGPVPWASSRCNARARKLVAGHATGAKLVGDHWLVICRCGWKPTAPQRARKAAIEHFEHLLAAHGISYLPAGQLAQAVSSTVSDAAVAP